MGRHDTVLGGRGIKIGSIGGVPIKVDSSWLLIAALVVYSFYARATVYGSVVVSEGHAIVIAVLATVLFFGSVLVHEGAHAVVARSLGLEVRGITLVFWGGFTETQADRKGPGGEFLISAAGPLTSLVLGGVFWVASRLVGDPLASETLGYLAWVNAVLAALNALPGFPLDGGRAFLAVIWKLTGSRPKAVQAASVAGMIIGGALIGLGALQLTTGQLGYAIWGFFIGMTMIGAARQAQRRESLRRMLGESTARDAMRLPPPAVPADLSLAEALDRYLRGHEHESFPVVDDERMVGVVSFESARSLGAEDPMRPVREGMIPREDVVTVQADDRLDAALDSLSAGRSALVMDGERLVGSLRPSDVQSYLEAKTAGAATSPGGGPHHYGAFPPRPDH